MKDTANCPYCQAEERGCSEAWGMGEDGWNELKKIHDEQHNERIISIRANRAEDRHTRPD